MTSPRPSPQLSAYRSPRGGPAGVGTCFVHTHGGLRFGSSPDSSEDTPNVPRNVHRECAPGRYARVGSKMLETGELVNKHAITPVTPVTPV